MLYVILKLQEAIAGLASRKIAGRLTAAFLCYNIGNGDA